MDKKHTDMYYVALHRCSLKKLGDFMSKRLKELNGVSAEQILEKSGQLDSVPVDLDKIFEVIKISKCPTTFNDLEKIKKTSVAGLVLISGDDVGIFYNKNNSIIQKRFTIAHEIGHCCLHGEMLKDGYIEFLHNDGFENAHEKEASIFASKLLIPEASLRKIYSQLLLPSLNGLADIFEVPVSLMKQRLVELKLKYYDEEKW